MNDAPRNERPRFRSHLGASASLALGLALVACSEGPGPRRLGDATFARDAGEAGVIGPRDASMDSSADAAEAEADASGSDAGSTASSCSVGAPIVLASVPSTASFAPAIASTGSAAVVAWIESRLDVTDVYARGVTASGDADPEMPLTDDTEIEDGLALVATDSGYVAAFAHSLLGGTDVRTLGFDATTGGILGTLDVTTDVDEDRLPLLMSTAAGAALVWERTLVQAGAFRQGLTTTGTASDSPAEVSATLAWTAPYALDATTDDIRLYHRLDASTLESIALDADGLEREPGATPETFDMSGYSVGLRIRTTPANATPRALLVAASDGANAATLLQRVSSSGAAVGSPIEVALADAPMTPAVTTYEGRIVVVYRTAGDPAPELRLRAYRSTGTRSADLLLQNLDAVSGSLEVITTADASTMVLVYDDVPDGTGVRELRVAFVTCTLP